MKNKSSMSGIAQKILAALVLAFTFGAMPLSAVNVTVKMQGTRFVPRDVTITVGDSITWTNLDFSGHDAVSGTNGIPDGYWTTPPPFGRGGFATVTFTNVPPGSYGYYCTPHVFVGMVGSVTVLPGNQPPDVSFIAPDAGALVPAGVPLQIQADATDGDGTVVRVDFFVDGVFLSSDSLGPFFATFPNPTPGNHTIRIQAVDNRGGVSVPETITITALAPPVIIQQPQNTNAIEFDPASFSVVATGAPPLGYQWRSNGVPISGATNSTFIIPSVRTNDNGQYSVLVFNQVGSVLSSSAKLSANQLPVVHLVTPTNNQPFANGAAIELLACASDSGSITNVEFFNGTNSAGVVTTAPFALTISNLAAGRSYEFKAVATDDFGDSAESEIATVFVLTPPAIEITSPRTGHIFALGESVPINTVTSKSPLPLAKEYFANALLLATDSFIAAQTGTNELLATVVDAAGQRATSAPVRIYVYQPEDQPPVIVLTNSPANFSRIKKSPLISLAGIAQDDVRVLRIEITNATSGLQQLASGTERWSADVLLAPGFNTINVRAVDQAFNPSSWVTRFFTYVTFDTVAMNTNGHGTISPNLDGQLLELGKTYRVTAKPARGWMFDRWERTPSVEVVSQDASLDFVMSSNLTLTAHFIESPFTVRAGPYAGLIQVTNSFSPEGYGLVMLQLTESGAFSGRLRAAGRSHSFKGNFDQAGTNRSSTAIIRPAQKPIVLSMQVDLASGAETIDGSATDGSWISSLLCRRNPYAAEADDSPYFGSRQFKWLDQVTSHEVAKCGMVLSVRGKVSATAKFDDGKKISVTTSVSRDGQIPLAFSSATHDSITGWASIGLVDNPRVTGVGSLVPVTTNNPSAIPISIAPAP